MTRRHILFGLTFLVCGVLVVLAVLQVDSISSPPDHFLVTSSSPRYSPQWIPDGTGIVFAAHPTFGKIMERERDDLSNAVEYWQGSKLYFANADGSRLTLLSARSGRVATELDIAPSISPSEERLLYTTTRHRETIPFGPKGCSRRRVFELETARLDGSDRERLNVSRPDGYWDVSPVWSPDGSSIAFARLSSCVTEEFGIYISDKGGSTPSKVAGFGGSTKWSNYKAGPVWSPDGEALAFVLDVPDQSAAPIPEDADASKTFAQLKNKALHFVLGDFLRQDMLYVVEANGTGWRSLFATEPDLADRIVGAPAWAPDGSHVAFTVYQDNYRKRFLWQDGGGDTVDRGNLQLGLNLYVVGADGSNLRLVGNVGALPPSTVELDWSPDATSIMVSDGRRVLLYGVHHSEPTMIVDAQFASWSPDGKRIAWSKFPGFVPRGSAILWTTASDGSERRDVVIYDSDRELAPAYPHPPRAP